MKEKVFHSKSAFLHALRHPDPLGWVRPPVDRKLTMYWQTAVAMDGNRVASSRDKVEDQPQVRIPENIRSALVSRRRATFSIRSLLAPNFSLQTVLAER